MSGDGVSLSTTLAQMGTVAKTQARGQQASPQVTPFSEQKEDQEELRVQRVKKASEAEKSRITGQDEEKDRRKRRRLKRKRKKASNPEGELAEGQKNHGQDSDSPGSAENELDNLGSLIDLRV